MAPSPSIWKVIEGVSLLLGKRSETPEAIPITEKYNMRPQEI